jgi:hypothetical protein
MPIWPMSALMCKAGEEEVPGNDLAHQAVAPWQPCKSRLIIQAMHKLLPVGFRGNPRPEQNDPILSAVMQHFARRCAWDAAAELFAQVVCSHAPAVVHLCVALERLGRRDDALQVCLCSLRVSVSGFSHVFSYHASQTRQQQGCM